MTPENKVEKLVELLRDERGLALVFVRTKRGADRLALRLAKHDVRAVAMHGDKTQAAREKALAHFEAGKVTTLIATDVAARGLDLSDITHVINFDPPEDEKAYTHRVGRTGRAGRSGTGVTLVLPDQQADVSRVARLNGQHDKWEETGMTVAAPRLVYSSRKRGSKWGPVGPGARSARTARSEAPRLPLERGFSLSPGCPSGQVAPAAKPRPAPAVPPAPCAPAQRASARPSDRGFPADPGRRRRPSPRARSIRAAAPRTARPWRRRGA